MQPRKTVALVRPPEPMRRSVTVLIYSEVGTSLHRDGQKKGNIPNRDSKIQLIVGGPRGRRDQALGGESGLVSGAEVAYVIIFRSKVALILRRPCVNQHTARKNHECRVTPATRFAFSDRFHHLRSHRQVSAMRQNQGRCSGVGRLSDRQLPEAERPFCTIDRQYSII
jgi:hypothetical protein